jgi:hypothetical protein
MKILELVKVVSLLLMIPLLIGHGWGSPGSGPREPVLEEEGMFRIDLLNSTVVDGALTIEVEAGNQAINLTSPTYSVISEQFPLSEGETFKIKIDSNQGDVGFGDLYLKTLDKKLLLSSFVVAESSGTFFDATYQLRLSDLSNYSDQDFSQGTSMISYLLSGGETGSESIEVPGTVSVYVNPDLIYEGTGINSPISFDAVAGNRLKVAVTDVFNSGSMSRLWIHRPDGLGQPLSYVTEITFGQQYSTTYEIP